MNDVAFSPDGRLFAAVSHLGYAKLWDRASLRELAVLRGFLMGVHSVAFSPDTKCLATGSDGLLGPGKPTGVARFGGAGFPFRPTAFSADGNVLAACNAQGELHLWRAPSWEQIEATENADITRMQAPVP